MAKTVDNAVVKKIEKDNKEKPTIKQKIIVLALALGVAFGGTACSAEPEANNKTEQPDDQPAVETTTAGVTTSQLTTEAVGDNDETNNERNQMVLAQEFYGNKIKYVEGGWDNPELQEALEEKTTLDDVYGIVETGVYENGGDDALDAIYNKWEAKGGEIGVDIDDELAVELEMLSANDENYFEKMWNKEAYELNVPVNPNQNEVVVGAINFRSEELIDQYTPNPKTVQLDGYKELMEKVDQYYQGQIDQDELDSYVKKLRPYLVLEGLDGNIYAALVEFSTANSPTYDQSSIDSYIDFDGTTVKLEIIKNN